MDRRLIPLNAILSLSGMGSAWPKPLADAGLRVHGLEFPINTSEGQVVADVILTRDGPRMIVMCEAKGGGNVEAAQARKYGAATPMDVRRSFEVAADASLAVMYACVEEHRSRIVEQLQALGLSAAVVSVGARRARMTGGSLISVADFDLAVPGLPPAVVAIDVDSDPDTISDLVRAELVAALAQSRQLYPIAELCAAIMPTWALLSRGAQGPLRRKVEQAVSALSADEMKRNIALERGSAYDTRVRLSASPEEFDPRGRTQGYQRIKRAAEEATGRTGRAPISGQLSLTELADEGGLEDG